MSYIPDTHITPDSDDPGQLDMESLDELISANLRLSNELMEIKKARKLKNEETVLTEKSDNNLGIFRQLNEFSVEVVAEQSNIENPLTQQAAQVVAEDTSYRLRELVHCAAQFMRHSFRTRLTTKDVSRAMHELDCDIIFGHNNSQHSLKYQFIPKAKVWVIQEDQLISLRLVASHIVAQSLNLETVRVGLPPAPFNVNWLQLKQFCDNSDNTFDADESTKLDIYSTQLCDLLCNINCSQYQHVSSFEKNSSLILICNDLSSNKNIKPLLSRLIKFAMNSLNILQRFTSPVNANSLIFSQAKLESYSLCFRMVNSLFRNRHFVDWSLQSDAIEPFADVLLSICFDAHLGDDPTQPYDSSLSIRSQFAFLFGQILLKFCLPFTDLQNRLMRILHDKIRIYQEEILNSNRTNHPTIDCVILILHRYLGFDVCLRYLLPLIMQENSIFDCYLSDMPTSGLNSSSSKSAPNVRKIIAQREICLVGELIMKGLALLLVQVVDDFVWVKESNQIYLYLVEQFGDALAARLSSLFDLAYLKSNRTQWMISWRNQLYDQTVKMHPPVKEEEARPATPKRSKLEPAMFETSPSNRNRKKRTTGLLESMLSTDTSKMAKSESLSIFTQSLLQASYREKEVPKMFLYPQDYDTFASSPSFNSSCANHLVIFEGVRLEENDAEKYKPLPNLSEWHKLATNYEPYKKAIHYLPSYRAPTFYEHQAELPVDIIAQSLFRNGNVKAEPDIKQELDCPRTVMPVDRVVNWAESNIARSRSLRRHNIFHYHRKRQHLLTSYSLYTQL